MAYRKDRQTQILQVNIHDYYPRSKTRMLNRSHRTWQHNAESCGILLLNSQALNLKTKSMRPTTYDPFHDFDGGGLSSNEESRVCSDTCLRALKSADSAPIPLFRWKVHVRPVSVLRRDALTSQLFRRPAIYVRLRLESNMYMYTHSSLAPRTKGHPGVGSRSFEEPFYRTKKIDSAPTLDTLYHIRTRFGFGMCRRFCSSLESDYLSNARSSLCSPRSMHFRSSKPKPTQTQTANL